MNKQELIKELTMYVKRYEDEMDEYDQGRFGAYKVALALARKLNEPQKLVIPPELAEYIQDNEGESIGDVFSYEWLTHYDNQQLGDKVAKWLFDNDKDENNRRYLIAVQAFITGDYEVEKEPLYRVKLGEGYFAKYLGIGALIIPDDTREFKIFNSKSDAERTASTIGGTVEEVAEG